MSICTLNKTCERYAGFACTPQAKKCFVHEGQAVPPSLLISQIPHQLPREDHVATQLGDVFPDEPNP